MARRNRREAILAAATGAAVAAALAWLAPPGADMAAHMYQRSLFLDHGFALWNNFWYAGRYSFVTYSLLYYPLAALAGIRALAVASVAVGAAAFAILTGHEWGATARWSSRTFAVVWAATVLTGAFPFLLGTAFALVALCAFQAGRLPAAAVLVVLTLGASPVAFLLLCVVLGAVALERRSRGTRLRKPAAVVLVIALAELLLWRAFPDGGRYPFAATDAAAAWTFSGIGLAVTWRVEAAQLLRRVFLLYLGLCVALFLIPSSVGENVIRLRYAAIPLAVLTFSLRGWRPRPVALVSMALATSWNLSALAANVAAGASDPASSAAYWQPAIAFLKAELPPSYRVEAVDTVGHWPAVYLPRAEIPLARGWFRQDDFPQNRVLYGRLAKAAYLGWLRRLGVLYVVSPRAPPDYSSRREQELIASGRSGLRLAFETADLAIYRVPSPRPIVVGPGHPRVLRLTASKLVLGLDRGGAFRVAVRFSPYWRPSSGCVTRSHDGMIRLEAPGAGPVELRFDVDGDKALAAVAGAATRTCAR